MRRKGEIKGNKEKLTMNNVPVSECPLEDSIDPSL